MKALATFAAALLLGLLLTGAALGCDGDCNHHPEPPPAGDAL